jgi:endonuclease/exonuclease/phosphatase family metal-dependent hydrolase
MLRLVGYNIRFGGRGREASIVAVLEQIGADVVVLQEATNPMVVHTVAKALGLQVIAAVPKASVAVLSRSAVDDVTWLTLRPGRGFVSLRLVDHDVRLFAVHLSSGLSRRGETIRIGEVAQLLAEVASGSLSARSIIAGDLNSIAPGDVPTLRRLPTWIRILLRFDGGIRSDVMSSLAAAGLVDAYRHLHPTEPGLTMPSTDPTVRLDYTMLGPDLVDRVLACGPADLDPVALARASDHLPLVTLLDV